MNYVWGLGNVVLVLSWSALDSSSLPTISRFYPIDFSLMCHQAYKANIVALDREVCVKSIQSYHLLCGRLNSISWKTWGVALNFESKFTHCHLLSVVYSKK
jgi:hypothetical protein